MTEQTCCRPKLEPWAFKLEGPGVLDTLHGGWHAGNDVRNRKHLTLCALASRAVTGKSVRVPNIMACLAQRGQDHFLCVTDTWLRGLLTQQRRGLLSHGVSTSLRVGDQAACFLAEAFQDRSN